MSGVAEQSRDWVRVPVGDEASRWSTRGRCRRVLLVMHNVTSATRLLDVLPLFRDDLRVQLLATCTGSSPFQSGVTELLDAVGVPVLPWEQAVSTPVDLAISASLGGQLDRITGALVVVSHGVGYNKTLRSAASDASAGNPPFGLAPEWLLADGVPVADAMVFSHPEQIARLASSCPAAVPTAVLGGDPCFDRILAARHHRERYRRALGVRPGQRLVLLNSTWNPDSLFGDSGSDDVLPLLLRRVASDLPVDEYRAAAVLHPNIRAAHGPGQVRLWLDRAARAGLALVDPLDGWRQALIAADLVIGDFGSVSYYAAALGTPVLLGSASLDSLGPTSPVADFVRTAPRLDPYAPLLPQVEHHLATHRPLAAPAEMTTSSPGGSAVLLRDLFYGLIGIPEPSGPALLDPLPLPPYEPAPYTAPLRVVTRVGEDGTIEVRRFSDPVAEPDGPGDGHLAVHEDTLDPGMLHLADLIWRHGAPYDPRLGTPHQWAAEVLDRYPGCALAAYVTGPHTCTVRHRDGLTRELTAHPDADPALYASAFLAHLATGATGDVRVRTGTGR
ncbi:hypothetical protein HA039_02060 [Streptomyces liangshanensis]|uniref:Uncharacterized protein n=1 Tax=Streptomyces liangshanensis TaxID=2717324 RepID=A0A6G9GT95_9ACTN|nr:hypothetical protein [Streptomyces liangshanensis]QIQ01241.1 hypothetical protein HA039_02060 [Streptomyces liangshanensis]